MNNEDNDQQEIKQEFFWFTEKVTDNRKGTNKQSSTIFSTPSHLKTSQERKSSSNECSRNWIRRSDEERGGREASRLNCRKLHFNHRRGSVMDGILFILTVVASVVHIKIIKPMGFAN